jgi:hypothetical protein
MASAPAIAPSPFLTGPSGRVIDGKAIADTIRAEVAAAVQDLKAKTGGKVRERRTNVKRRARAALSRRRRRRRRPAARSLEKRNETNNHKRPPSLLSPETKTLNQVPGLAVIIVGDRKDSRTYVAMKHKACAECGVASFSRELPDTATQEDVLAAVEAFNADDKVHGILVQLPVRKRRGAIDKQQKRC